MKETGRNKMRVKASASVCFFIFAFYLFPFTFAQEKEEIDIRGKITNIRRADRGVDDTLLGAILIEGVKEADTGFDKASVRVTNETRIFDERETERKQVSFDALKTGQKVSARFVGPVMESYPVQATAGEIIILD
jgi:beta-N-acetylhexosaminidase